jgi:hypothetical protein
MWGECVQNMATRPRRPAPTMPAATGALVGAIPVLFAVAVAPTTMLLGELV